MRKLSMHVVRETRRLEALVDLRLLERAALERGLAPDLDWDDLPRRSKAHILARKAEISLLLLPTLPGAPPPPQK